MALRCERFSILEQCKAPFLAAVMYDPPCCLLLSDNICWAPHKGLGQEGFALLRQLLTSLRLGFIRVVPIAFLAMA